MTNAPVTPTPSTTALETSPDARPGRLLLLAALLVLTAALLWLAWLGWDTEYSVVDGNEQGPYQAWQVIGAAVSMAVATVVAYLAVRGVLAVFALPIAAAVGFGVPWTVQAAATDDSGLFVIGAVLVFLGIGVGLGLVLALVAPVAAARDRAKQASAN